MHKKTHNLLIFLLVPFVYVVCSVVLDIAVFGLLGWNFPSSYLFSLALIMFFATVVGCIPNRWVQICIFFSMLFFKAVTVVGMIIAYENLGELFILETFRALREISSADEASNLNIFIPVFTSVSIAAFFLIVTIPAAIWLRHHRPTYSLKGIVSICCIICLTFTVQGFNKLLLPQKYDTLLDNHISNNRFNLRTFHNRHHHFRTFGPAMFYTRNFLEIINFSHLTSSTNLHLNYQFDRHNPSLENPQYEFALTPEYNVIMLMLEGVESDAINPFVTPNLWHLQSMSTGVDGFYAHERTCFAEYVALVGSHLSSVEMWSSFQHVETPQALPHIFNRGGANQVAAFHNNYSLFYNRHRMFPNMGFDHIYDMTNLGERHYRPLIRNSDSLMFETMYTRIAPAEIKNQPFFSYVLNLGTHSPHFYHRDRGSVRTILYPSNTNDNDKWNLNVAARAPSIRDNHQRALDEILAVEHVLREFYPRLTREYHTDNNGNLNLRRYNNDRIAIMNYLVSVRDFDNGLGILLNHLRTTPDLRRGGFLIDTTAIIVFSDHFNHVVYANPQNRDRGGLLSSHGYGNLSMGEQLPFFIYNPTKRHYMTLHHNATVSMSNLNSLRDTAINMTNNFTGLDQIPHLDQVLNSRGLKIERFMSIKDVYRTITHLFDIRTSDMFSLGVSVLDYTATTNGNARHYVPNNYSVALGFVTQVFTGLCLSTGNQFLTRDFINFQMPNGQPSFAGTAPCDRTIKIHRERLETTIATMLNLRTFYTRNSFITTHAALYTFTL